MNVNSQGASVELSDRQIDILSRIKRDGRVDVDDLAGAFAVTTQTIRRDLNELCTRGLAARIHGGAMPAVSVSNVDYQQRRQLASTEKESIGRVAAQLIPDHCSVILNIGTTVEQVARALYEHTGLVVITNNINVVSTLTGSRQKDLVLVGGTVRQSDGAIVGEDAVEFISRYKADFACIGASAMDEDGAILDFDAREVSVARAILKNARTKILVSDSLKFERTAPVRICDIGDIDYFVTDNEPPESFRRVAELRGARIVTLSDAKFLESVDL
ncbi:DeoR/GlpR family DNA-binding transcription regulator [Litoricolaceae bacterium]|nr:DeoR/GlpR family DNA-binding transcription regulator [Litorivicinaceae bacterium]